MVLRGGPWGVTLCCLLTLALLAACNGDYAKTRSFAVDDEPWEEWKDPETDETYYFNPDTKISQWGFPRSKLEEKIGRRMMILICVVPLVGLLSLCFGRIYYLKAYYPDLLNPTKVRKPKVAKRGKLGKGFKHRFKISQDGKGGRSANS
ncbi:hypothetical protein BSKO_12497 [Bryopsis sp. KO-2023]|nr:hypothetical protein BSKO_12497 [Bryopsis sp. KO-2023]